MRGRLLETEEEEVCWRAILLGLRGDMGQRDRGVRMGLRVRLGYRKREIELGRGKKKRSRPSGLIRERENFFNSFTISFPISKRHSNMIQIKFE